MLSVTASVVDDSSDDAAVLVDDSVVFVVDAVVFVVEAVVFVVEAVVFVVEAVVGTDVVLGGSSVLPLLTVRTAFGAVPDTGICTVLPDFGSCRITSPAA